MNEADVKSVLGSPARVLLQPDSRSTLWLYGVEIRSDFAVDYTLTFGCEGKLVEIAGLGAIPKPNVASNLESLETWKLMADCSQMQLTSTDFNPAAIIKTARRLSERRGKYNADELAGYFEAAPGQYSNFLTSLSVAIALQYLAPESLFAEIRPGVPSVPWSSDPVSRYRVMIHSGGIPFVIPTGLMVCGKADSDKDVYERLKSMDRVDELTFTPMSRYFDFCRDVISQVTSLSPRPMDYRIQSAVIEQLLTLCPRFQIAKDMSGVETLHTFDGFLQMIRAEGDKSLMNAMWNDELMEFTIHQ